MLVFGNRPARTRLLAIRQRGKARILSMQESVFTGSGDALHANSFSAIPFIFLTILRSISVTRELPVRFSALNQIGNRV